MTKRAGSRPPRVSLASPVAQPPSVRHSARISGPPARWMAPSTPPPPSSVVLAAFTIASTASFVMSPRTRASLESAMLRFVNQANAARIFVKRSRRLHRARVAVQRKGLHFRMAFPPFGKGAAHSTRASHIKIRGELAHVVENDETARGERSIPEIELGESRSVFVGAVE